MALMSLWLSLPLTATADVRVCNGSSRSELQVASVIYNPAGALMGMVAWSGEGYDVVAPGRCETIFDDTTRNTSIWLRVTAGGRFIPGYTGRGAWTNGDFHETAEKFCVNPNGPFKWRRTGMGGAYLYKDCDRGSEGAQFSFHLDVTDSGQVFVVSVDPDPTIAKNGPSAGAVAEAQLEQARRAKAAADAAAAAAAGAVAAAAPKLIPNCFCTADRYYLRGATRQAFLTSCKAGTMYSEDQLRQLEVVSRREWGRPIPPDNMSSCR